MNRHFYISDDLDELEVVERDLEASGVAKPQIHVLSENDAGVESHHLHEVESVLKQDVVHSGEIGFVAGLVGAGAVLYSAHASGLPEVYTWVPFLFLSVIVLGFCTWEGVFIGIQKPHYEFRRFSEVLRQGRHVFFVDVESRQEPLLDSIIGQHPDMQMAGVGNSAPNWVINARTHWHRFINSAP